MVSESDLAPSEPPLRATVVVCTRNRSTALAASCAAVLELDAPFAWELLVVDNASTDDTLAVAQELARRWPERMRVAVEPTLGLSAARNLGVRLARGEWIAFLDDDAEPRPGWLAAYDAALAEPGTLGAGGPVVPRFAGPLPAWFDDGFLPYVSAWDRGVSRHPLRYNELPRGCNMAFRRAAFELVGPFDHRLGRRGRSLRSCEEIELALRLERAGAAIVYEPAAAVVHEVVTERMTPEWMVRRFAAQGFSEAIVEWKHGGLDALRAGRQRYRASVQHHERAGGAALMARCHRAAAAAYLRGALYGLVVVERWRGPGAVSAPG